MNMRPLEPSTVEALIAIAAGIVCVHFGFRRGADASSPTQSGKLRMVLRWIGPALVIFGIVLYLSASDPAPPAAPKLVNDIKAKLTLPVQIDEDTRLDDIRALSDREIEYRMTITTRTEAELKDQRFAEVLEFSISADACVNPDHLTLLRGGFHLTLSYRSSDGHDVANITVVPDDCARQLRQSQ